jgi:hypothetical protein
MNNNNNNNNNIANNNANNSTINSVSTSSNTNNTNNYMSSTDTISKNQRETLHSRFDFVKVLGKGTYGKVKLANDKRTGKQVNYVSCLTRVFLLLNSLFFIISSFFGFLHFYPFFFNYFFYMCL